jgi:hypothetical protein
VIHRGAGVCARPWPRVAAALAAVTLAATLEPAARAFSIDTADPDFKASWDNTVKYSAAWRVHTQDKPLISNPNLDDGDRNFNRGLISDRFDLFSEADLVYQNRLGARVSGAAWYDTVYNSNNDNPGFAGGAFPNQLSVPYNHFTEATAVRHGRDAELLDGFVFGRFELAGKRASVRLGQHSLVWGESVFFGANAIAGGMMPVDVIKLISVPNTQFKEAILPVPMLSGQLEISPSLAVGAYYQLQWRADWLPASGSYFSQLDPIPEGGEQILLAGPGSPFLSNAAHGADQPAGPAGQGGVQLRFRLGETDYGVYFIRFNDKSFQEIINLGPAPVHYVPFCSPGVPGFFPTGPSSCATVGPIRYHLAYHEGITALGASASHTFGVVNLAVEASVRHNMDLASTNAVDLSALGARPTNNSDSPAYAIGRTAHANASVLSSLPPTFLYDEATLLAEVAWNRVLSVSRNAAALDPNASRDASALRVLFIPGYPQALSGVDLSVPIGVGVAPRGSRTMALGPGVFPPSGGGDATLGVNVNYLDRWRFSLAFTHYFGAEGGFLTQSNHFSYLQSLKDRDFIALSARTTF